MAKETVYDPIHDAQRHFRILLDATARPGKILRLDDVPINPPDDLYRASALIGFALLNADVGFYLDGKSKEAVDYFVVNTASYQTSASEADFLFISGEGCTSSLGSAKIGTPRYPEGGATIIVEVERICDDALLLGGKVGCRPFPYGKTPTSPPRSARATFSDAMRLVLSGPGVPGEKVVYIRGLDLGILDEILEKNQEFPLGVDTIVTDKQDGFFCIPRTMKLSWKTT
jgi:alpha-D-ribose 1-methylphosphonate 5-triphosphate synthase subunit PhnH